MSPALTLGACGFGLIAVCYGFARFAFGLFLPQIDAELSLSTSLSGFISGGAFLGYCVAIVASAYLTERLGPRLVAIGAALVAGIGMLGIVMATSAWWLALAVMLAGSSTGLASPPMAAAVDRVVAPKRQSLTNTVINAGTGAGVVLSGSMALWMEDWRLAFAGFAATALLLSVAVAFSVPGGKHKAGAKVGKVSLNALLIRLIMASFLMGAASTAVWSFGGQLLALRLDWGHTGSGLLWIAIGGAGMAGAFAGALITRFGINPIHRIFLAALALGVFMVGMVNTTPAMALIGGLLFGMAYIMLTGVYLVWGINALPERPATGLMVGFLTIAVGQTAGAPVFGMMMDQLGATTAVVAFAGLTLTAAWARG
ncbi:YbfB/YjiJ family MFS transporter [Halomonas sp. PAMB 3264]|uniref:MFS transporter n=1 Tax=Halomonas sp. PAMB 3264 TaxID=3075222 RepID=UPI00289B2E5C|nr:MFS transporter [Halomonas sp. PAMB 3264]WNL42471.1 YbfB/YjiJ family MFS transporter [Halomonas sp. PAMB 3264]